MTAGMAALVVAALVLFGVVARYGVRIPAGWVSLVLVLVAVAVTVDAVESGTW